LSENSSKKVLWTEKKTCASATPPPPNQLFWANPFPKVTDPFCRLPLPTLFYQTRGFSPWRPDAVSSTTKLEGQIGQSRPAVTTGFFHPAEPTDPNRPSFSLWFSRILLKAPDGKWNGSRVNGPQFDPRPALAKTTLSHSWSKDNVCNRKTESHNDYIPEPPTGRAPHGLSNRLAARERFWHPAGAQIHPWFFKKKRKLFLDFKKTSQSSFAWDVVARNQTPPKVRCRFLFSFPLVCFGIGLLTDFPFSYSFGDHGLVSIYSPAPIIFHNLSD